MMTSLERACLILRDAEKRYWEFVTMAADFHALDFRPWLVNTATGETSRIGEFSLPGALVEAMAYARRDVLTAQEALLAAYERAAAAQRPVDPWLVRTGGRA